MFEDCLHRGEVVGTVTCTTCGDRGKEVEVYGCDVWGECTERRTSVVRDAHVSICLLCDDYTGEREMAEVRVDVSSRSTDGVSSVNATLSGLDVSEAADMTKNLHTFLTAQAKIIKEARKQKLTTNPAKAK